MQSSGYIKRLCPCDRRIIETLYAACYFHSEIYRWEIENVSMVFTTYASIDNKKLSKIPVFPDMETQHYLRFSSIKNNALTLLQKKLLKEFEHFLIQQCFIYPILDF